MAVRTWETVCNLGLAHLGEEPIASLSADGDTENLLLGCYEEIRDQVLEAYDWVPARWRKEITADGTAPDFGWDYRYLLPVNPYCLRLLEVKNTGDAEIGYELEGRYVLCDEAEGIRIKYVKQIVDPTELSASLAAAISMRIAMWVEPKFSNSQTVRDRLAKELEALILEAKANGACQDFSDEEDEPGVGDKNFEWSSAGR